MSNERAYVNCNRCNYLACNDPEDPLKSDKIFGAKNEVIKALEDSQRDCLELSNT
jgi:hypothetical protein